MPETQKAKEGISTDVAMGIASRDLDLWPPSGQSALKGLAAKEEKGKEISHMQEAPVSFNVKFIHKGFECQLTVRGEQEEAVTKRASWALSYIEHLGAEPVRITIPAKNGNGKDEAKTYLCPACKVEGQPVTATSKKNGKAFHSLKCPQCNEFLPGTFRWQ